MKTPGCKTFILEFLLMTQFTLFGCEPGNTANQLIPQHPMPDTVISALRVTFERAIEASEDDVDVSTSCVKCFDNDAPSLYLVSGSPGQSTGLRFASIDVPRSATNVRATLRLVAAAEKRGTAGFTVKGFASDDAAPFISGPDFASRITTRASTRHAPTPWQTGQPQDIDVSTIVEEILSRPGFAPGNDIGLMLSAEGVDGDIKAVAFDGAPQSAARLRIDYDDSVPLFDLCGASVFELEKASLSGRATVRTNPEASANEMLGNLGKGGTATIALRACRSGTFGLSIRLASGEPRSLAVHLDGAALAPLGPVNTGTFGTFSEFPMRVELAAGTHHLRIGDQPEGAPDLDLLRLANVPPPGEPADPKTQTVTFTADDNPALPNPERGFAEALASYSNDPRPLTEGQLDALKARGITVVSRRYVMTTFRSSHLSPAWLSHIDADAALLRAKGMKMNVRFSYTFNEPFESTGHQDTSIDWMLNHVDQLKPTLTRNEDVIAYVEAGFIGRWGEWNKSSNNLDADKNTPEGVKAQRQLIDRLLSTVPSSRMVALRYLDRKIALISPQPLTVTEAYSRTPPARIGHTNDYFTIDNFTGNRRSYLEQDTRFTVQGGEPIKLNPSEPSRSSCTGALDELSRYHWSTMNFPGTTFQSQWESCLPTIAAKLGYRFALLDATFPKVVKPNGTLTATMTMSNTGFASPYNPRGIELVLRKNGTSAIRLPAKLTVDSRAFLPAPKETKPLTLSVVLPDQVPAGEYELFLNLPDPSPTLSGRADYSIRLANQGTWESSTGYNRLGRLTVEQ
jgi:Domain of unknown function (DUF4832)/Domain of unknown function (DUF4874)